MNEKDTTELEGILSSARLSDYDSYCADNADSMIGGIQDFNEYLKSIFAEKEILLQTVFLQADIPERYGYKLLSGQKHTRQRDVILRICYAGELSLDETQRALKMYGMPVLYAKLPRDAMLMLIFKDRPGNILEVNELLKKKGLEPLRTSGTQD